MKTNLKERVKTREGFQQAGAEQRLKERGTKLPTPPEPFGIYVEAVQTGNLLFLSGMLPTEGHGEIHWAASARSSMWKRGAGRRNSRLGVSVATSGDVRDQPKVADAASELLQDVFGKDKSPCRLAYGVASLPLGTPVELEVILEARS
jgi:enamine deaminase RidA (YjgF/YER057c/UK114 family)